MNTKLLEEVRQQILNDPQSFTMSTYYEKIYSGHYISDHKVKYTCGTVGCICGWSARLKQIKSKKSLDSLGLYHGYADEEGVAKLLGISTKEADCLFHENNWPSSYKRDYISASTPQLKAKITANLLKEVIKRGKVWWDSSPS